MQNYDQTHKYPSEGTYYTKGGLAHRIDGPAYEWPDGDKWWYLENFMYTFEGWKKEVRKYYETQEDYLLMLLKLD